MIPARKRQISLFPFFLLFIFFLALPKVLLSQTEIGGVINSYSAVTSVNGNQSVIVDDASPFQQGDTVLLIQMKGLGVITEPPEDYGRQQDINNAGNYEFLIVEQVNGDEIVFTREFLKEYDEFETAQLIRVRGYESARITSSLEALEWDGAKGGVIALIVTNTLYLEADINVSGHGFRGGNPVTLDSGECSSLNPDNQEFSFPAGTNIAGEKGEGAATYYIEEEIGIPLGNDFVYGRGRMSTGGGGGNGLFAGGGGGSNYGPGGFGGMESDECPDSPYDTEGFGGSGLADQLFDTEGLFLNRLFMGGGGGGSTQFGTRLATRGGNGGGMVIIVANYIEGNDTYGIYANGEDVVDIATAGGGGGGGGGTIVASIDNYMGTVNIHAHGGRGGDVENIVMAGPGGGGGEGTVIHSGSSLPPGVSTFVSPGGGGTNILQNDPHGSTNGSPPSLENIVHDLEISLNGFLFNGIRTARDLVCEETAPDIIEGTQPRGGKSPYQFEWFKKTGTSEWTMIEGANEIDYQPGVINETTRFLRVVKDSDEPVVIDSSNYITIDIQPKIIGNIIENEQTICEGETPEPLQGPGLTIGGTGVFDYLWNQRTAADHEWEEAENINDQLTYIPPPLFDSTFFIRIAVSGVCTDTSNILPVYVHPSITGNTLNEDQVICHGSTPKPVTGLGQPGGGLGEGNYDYYWEGSTNDEWTLIDENGNGESYAPGQLTGTIRYRRTVESGACTDTSPHHTITVLPSITGNAIGDDQTICYLDAPEIFTGALPGGGDGSYRYNWESSTLEDQWISAEGNSSGSNYLSDALSDTIFFRRIVRSGPDDVCSDTSNIVSVVFHPFSNAEIIFSSDTICSGEQSPLAFSLHGEGPWQLVMTDGFNNYSVDDISTNAYNWQVAPSTADSATFTFRITSLTDRFGCSALEENLSGEALIRVYAFPDPNAGAGGDMCGPSFHLDATRSFGTGIWEALTTGTIFFPDAYSTDATATVSEYGTHEFRWTETNWQCHSTDEITVTFYEQPGDISAGADQELMYIFETRMQAELPANIMTAYGEWEIVEGRGEIVFPDDPATMVTGLGIGENILRWTVYNGACSPVSDLVSIIVGDLQRPTGFSPNNSGFNDSFIIKGLENSEVNELIIFNRQGNIVFRAENYKNDWDGRNFNGTPLPEDTYYYILKVDNRHTYNGFIVLKR